MDGMQDGRRARRMVELPKEVLLDSQVEAMQAAHDADVCGLRRVRLAILAKFDSVG
jgi:hypothetical protein